MMDFFGHHRALSLLLLAVAGILIYGAAAARCWVEVTRHSVILPGLPPELEGLRLVQLSDLHIGPLFRAAAVRRMVSLANRCEPDLVVLTGDFVNYRSMRYVPHGARELAALRARLGIFACLGNHDYWEGAEEVRAAFGEGGVPVLMNENVRVGEALWLAAVDDLMSGQPDLPRALEGLPQGTAVVLLSHNPTVLPQVAEKPWLVLAGHTHGGQIALPFLGPHKTARMPGIRWLMRVWESVGVRARGGRLEAVSTYRYPAGWYEEGQARMYINRGIGFNLGWPVRINCPPEIACFTLHAERRNTTPPS